METVLLIHGWSVTETSTYQALHRQLAQHGFDLQHVYLGRYVSLANEVTIQDIAHAMDHALTDVLGKGPWNGRVHMVTHSTGALVAKQWLQHYYTGKRAAKRSIKNIVFLAGPHFGSRLAHHGRTMIAQSLMTYGPSGREVLNALELGSPHSWDAAEHAGSSDSWLKKGIRPFCLTGDRIERDFFKSKVFPAGYETGSDSVVRVAAANLNSRRYKLDAKKRGFQKQQEVKQVPFAALHQYVHSEVDHGIMNSITQSAEPNNAKYLSLKMILECLSVRNNADYTRMYKRLARATQETRKKRRAFAQLDLWFRDETGEPITDYVWELGVYKNGKQYPSKTIAHTHKNKVDESHFTVFLDLKHFEPKKDYFMRMGCDSGTSLYRYEPNEFTVQLSGQEILNIISPDQTCQLEVVFGREPHRDLFRFHPGDDDNLHVRWDREGKITKNKIPTV